MTVPAADMLGNLHLNGDPLPDAAMPMDAVIAVKYLSADGTPMWTVRNTPGITIVEALGVAEWMAEHQRIGVRRAADG